MAAAEHYPPLIFPGGRNRETPKRLHRVAELIQSEIAGLLLSKVKDPRLKNVSVVSVSLTRDLRKAMIHYSVFGDESAAKAAGDALQKANGFIRSHLARTLNLRVTPELQFKHDLSLEYHEHMERLLKELKTDADKAAE